MILNPVEGINGGFFWDSTHLFASTVYNSIPNNLVVGAVGFDLPFGNCNGKLVYGVTFHPVCLFFPSGQMLLSSGGLIVSLQKTTLAAFCPSWCRRRIEHPFRHNIPWVASWGPRFRGFPLKRIMCKPFFFSLLLLVGFLLIWLNFTIPWGIRNATRLFIGPYEITRSRLSVQFY